MANQSKVLMFHIEPQKAKHIEAVCRKLHLTPVKIKPSAYGQKLGYLAGISGFDRENISSQQTEFPSEMIVFSGMTPEQTDEFLSAYKAAKIAPVKLKAVVTAHNIFWSADELYRELFQEHTRMHSI